MRTIRVGLAGLGHVGYAVARLFDWNAARFSKRLGVRIELTWACDLQPDRKLKGLRFKNPPRLTRHYQHLLEDPALDIVIELVGGVEVARPLVLGALRAGKRVITANKELLAREWETVFKTADRYGSRVAFEASVAGAVPVLQALNTGLAANEISQVVGILNGTTNHILTQMAHRGWSFDKALREAQDIGMAERDPSLDIDGIDTTYKMSVLASMLSSAWVRPDRIYREGIRQVALEDIRFATRELGRTVRLLGILRFDWARRPVRLEARVHPTLVPLDHPLAAVHGGYNAVMVQASAAKDLMFYGLGAGPEPAASAVLSDLFQVAQELAGRRPFVPESFCDRRILLRPIGEIESSFYLRLNAVDRPGVLAKVAGTLAREGISISQIHQKFERTPQGVPIVITTHPVSYGRMERALRSLRRLKELNKDIVCLWQL